MRCAKCGADNREGRKFCAKCAAPLARLCPQCGASNEPGENFCGECAAPLGQAPTASTKKSNDSPILVAETPAPENLEGERKTVTALFADIKGSTELEQDLDPEEASAIIDPALKLMIDAVRRYDGYIVQSTGDGIFALFGAPVAHEDHPQRALYAALRMQEELTRYSARLREAGNLPIEARVGVNTGEVVVRSIATGGGHTEYTPIGHTTNLASRMQALAPTGSIAISEQTRKFVEGYFELKALGPTRVKGVSEPVNVYQVTGIGTLRTRLQRSAGRGYTKFVGRQREMDAMKAAADQAKAGRGQIVAAMAEAGVGKSRLMFEFKATSAQGWMVLEAFSVSHGKASSYMPVIDLLHSYFKIASQDDQRTRREKIAGRIAILDRSLESAIPYLYSLLGISEASDPAQMDGQIKKRRTLDAIKRILIRESLNQPLMVIFEDLHWIDDETQALLNLLADSIGTAKILLLVNYRPEYSHQWNSKTYYTQLRVDPLGKESADEMLQSLLGDSAELAPLKRLIIEKTEGTPFFMEETVEMLLDEGALVRNGSIKLVKPLSELKIPPTVQAILASRIDRLPAREKELLQQLAVMGRQFSLPIIQDVTSQDVTSSSADELDSMLSHLQLAEFIYEQPAPGSVEYTFKHALTQDVAYSSVLVERRKLLHQRIGEAIEKAASDRADRAEELVHHFGRSGDARKSAEYMRIAGEQALNRAAYLEALERARQGLAALERIEAADDRDRLEVGLQILLGWAIDKTKGGGDPELNAAFSRALELAPRGASLEQKMTALWGLQSNQQMSGHPREAQKYAEQFLEAAKQSDDPRWLASGRLHLAHTLSWRGLFPEARKLAEQALPGAKLAIVGDERPWTHNVLARQLWFLGFPDQALRRMEEAMAFVSLANLDPKDLLYPAVTAVAARLAEHAMRLAGQLGAFAAEHELPFFSGYAAMLRGASLLQVGRDDEGLQLLEPITEYLRRSGSNMTGIEMIPQLEAYGRVNRIDYASELLELAFSDLESTGCELYAAELWRVRGELLLLGARPNPAAGEDCIRKAIEVAQAQQAKSLELRATTSLARLLAKQGRRDEARAMLADIYGWFTEGFDTADLKDAKALLDELNA
jgi:class 3 adenylate cyclase/tetratricopeptide (TPR) repeat protein